MYLVLARCTVRSYCGLTISVTTSNSHLDSLSSSISVTAYCIRSLTSTFKPQAVRELQANHCSGRFFKRKGSFATPVGHLLKEKATTFYCLRNEGHQNEIEKSEHSSLMRTIKWGLLKVLKKKSEGLAIHFPVFNWLEVSVE